MRKIIYIFVLSFLFSAVSAKPTELLTKAEAAYDTKNYKLAIECYEQLVKQGYHSDILYYNLGNSYYRNNQLGKAIYNYELAKKLNPKDADIQNNLALAYSKTVDKIETKENFFVSAVKTSVLCTCTTNTWAWLSIASVALTLLLLFGFIAGGSVSMRRISFFAALIFAVAFFITYSFGYSALKDKQQNSFAIVTAPQTKVFVEPTLNSTSKFGLHEGTRVRLIETNADWVLIKLENGNEGWLKATDVGLF
jgi:tetratricopeptide (TPR) repeat protein